MATMPAEGGASRLREVQRLLAEYREAPPAVSDEALLALRVSARAAIDRLDDEPEFDDAHATLDEVGRLVRENRPHLCVLTDDGDDFTDECPVSLGHIRLGFSVGVEIEESHCSICKQDPWECPHIPGELYGDEPMVRVITKANLFEASLVERPDFPDARILGRSVSRASIEAAVGGRVRPGYRPLCDRCLAPCPGI